MNVRRLAISALGLALLAAVTGCSGGSDDNLATAAARATAQFWQQEAAAGTLPEGVTVREHGTTPNGVVELDVPGDAAKGTKARFCVEFEYIRAAGPFDNHVRVYISTLVDKAWVVVMEKPDGTCDGVS